MAFKPYTVKKEINGTEYVAQFSGISAALKAVDSSYVDGTNNTSVERPLLASMHICLVIPYITNPLSSFIFSCSL